MERIGVIEDTVDIGKTRPPRRLIFKKCSVEGKLLTFSDQAQAVHYLPDRPAGSAIKVDCSFVMFLLLVPVPFVLFPTTLTSLTVVLWRKCFDIFPMIIPEL